MDNPKLLQSILEALLEELGYRGPKKPVDEILPQLKTQTRRRLDSTDAKKRQLQEHLEHLSAMTSSIADEVNVIQDSVQQKFRDMRRLLDEKEAKFKQDVAALASDVAASITEQEEQCQTVIGDLQHEADQLAHALEQETELGFVSGIANMPKHELEIDAALLKVPSVNFQARATLNSEPICQMIGELEFNVQQVRAPPVEYTPLSSSSSRPLARSPAMHVGALGGYSSTSVFASPQRTASSARDVPPSRELFVGGLPLHSSEDQVRQIFEGFGVIESLDMSNVAKGFAFVTMENVDAAKAAVSEPGLILEKRQLCANDLRYPTKARVDFDIVLLPLRRNVRFKLPRRR